MAQSDFIVKNGAVILNGLTATSTSTTTGALVINGGIGLSGNSTFGGDLRITSATSSTNSTTGALTLLGGLGVFGDVNIGTNLRVRGVDLMTFDDHVHYVADGTGSDSNDGHRLQSAFRTIKFAVEQANAGDTIFIEAGTYQEEFPIEIPAGVSVRGAGLREVYVYPTTATNTQSAFLLNGETTISDFTVGGFYKPGYAFKFAPNAKITTRSPYVERFSVITRGSNPQPGDPYGYDSDDAGGGAYLDGANVDPTSIEAAFLFNEATFITAGADAAVYITNGVRVELLNGFSYFAKKAIHAVSGSTGWGGQGRTRLRLTNSTGTFTVGHNLYYIGSTGTVAASGEIVAVDSNYVYLDGKASGFVEAQDRSGKTVNVYGDTQISSFQRKIGTASARFTSNGDLLDVVSDQDLQYGLNAYTLESYVYLTSNGFKQQLFNKGLTSATAFGLYLNSANKLTGQHGNTVFTATTTINTGSWYHVAMVRDAYNTNKLFVNGVLEATTTATTSVNNTDSLTMGGVTASPTLSLKGYMDEVRVSSIARYSTTFTPATTSFSSDVATTLLLHCDGADGSILFRDDGLGSQNVYSTTSTYNAAVVASAQQISLADYRQFGGELRCIGSAACYGGYGIYADGEGVDLKAIAFNMSFVGSGKDFTNDPTLTVQDNEVVMLNGAKVYYQTVDQVGDFRVGEQFRINQRTGNVDFGTANFNLGPLSSLTISDGTNSSVLQPTSIQVGSLLFSANKIQTITGNLTLDPSGSLTTIESDLQVNGGLNFTGQFLATSNANSTSTTTGAIVVSGGIGMGKDLYVGGKATIVGDLVVLGQQTSVSTSATSITDPVIDLGIGPNQGPVTTNDGVDRGLLLHYNTTTNSALYSRTFLGMDINNEKLIYKTNVVVGAGVSPLQYANYGNWGLAKFGGLELVNTTNATSTSTGALIVAGGAGFGGDVWAKNMYSNSSTVITTATIANYAVSYIAGGADISVNANVGSVIVSNTSTLQSVTSRGSSTNVVISFTNTTSAISTSTGAVTIAGGLGVGGTIYAKDMYSNGSQVITAQSLSSLGVTSLTAGTDTAVSTSTGAVVIWNTSTLQTITNRGNSTTNAISILNTTTSYNTLTGALIVSGGVGILLDVNVGGDIYSRNVKVLTTETDTLQSVTLRGSSSDQQIGLLNNTDSTNLGTGALTVAGGVYIAKSLFTRGAATISANSVGTVLTAEAALTLNGSNNLQTWNDTAYGTIDMKWVGTASGYFSLVPRSQKGIKLGANEVVSIAQGTTGSNFVGINTATATAQLEVGGDIKAANIYSNGSQVLTNATLGTYGVTSITGGSGISVSTSTGAVTITSVDNLQSVTDRGNSTTNALIITNTTQAGSSNTGALIVSGGVGVQRDMYVAGTGYITEVRAGAIYDTGIIEVEGIASFKSLATATDVNTGGVQIWGGAGVRGSLYAAALYDGSQRVVTNVNPTAGPGIGLRDKITVGTATSFTIDNTGVIAVAGTSYIGVSSATGIVTFTNLGVQTLTAGTDTRVSASTGTITIWNTSTLQSITSRGATTDRAISITTTTQSTGTLNGALTVAGGVGIAGNLNVGGNTIFAGDVTFNGTATYVYSTNTIYTDNLIELHTPPGGPSAIWTLDDGKDIGIKFRYFANSTNTNGALVLANDTKYLEWYNTGAEGTSTFAGSSYGTFKTGAVKLAGGTSATNTSTGDLTVEGGAGIGQNLYVGNKIYVGGLEVLTTSSLGSGGVGVTTITAGTDTAVDVAFGAVTIWNTSTLETITSRGSVTSAPITITNGTNATSTNTGALQVSGGVAVGRDLYVAGALYGNIAYQEASLSAGICPTANYWIKCLTFSIPNIGDSVSFKIRSTVKAVASTSTSDNFENDTLWFSYVKDTATSVLGTTYWVNENSELGLSVASTNHSVTYNATTGLFEYWRRSTVTGARAFVYIMEEIAENSAYQFVSPTIVQNGTWASAVTSLGSTVTIDDIDVSTFEDLTITSTLTVGGNTTLANTTSSNSVNISTGINLTGVVKTVNIATAGATGSISNVNIGSTTTGAVGQLTIGSTQTLITSTLTSVSTTTGALVVRGGVGIGENLLVGPGAIARVNDANAFSNGYFAAAGDAQAGMYIVRGAISTTTQTALSLTGTTATTANSIVLPNNSAYMFKVFVSAKAVSTNDEGAWEFSGSIARYANSSTTVMRMANKTKIWSSQAGYDVNVSANTGTGALEIIANGTSTSVVRFVAKVETVEVTA